jgi:hypothetical protein
MTGAQGGSRYNPLKQEILMTGRSGRLLDADQIE